MIWIFVFTLNDSFDNLIIINPEMVNSNELNIFPSVSICVKIDKFMIKKIPENIKEISSQKIKEFVLKYYAEHKIDEPK